MQMTVILSAKSDLGKCQLKATCAFTVDILLLCFTSEAEINSVKYVSVKVFLSAANLAKVILISDISGDNIPCTNEKKIK